MRVKNRTCYYFDDIIKLEDFDIVIDEKANENILIYDILYKTLICSKPLCIRFHKIDGFIRIYDGNIYLTYIAWFWKTKPFTTELDIL